MKVKIKKLDKSATIPSYAKSGDAGLDLTSISKSKEKNGMYTYGTGLAIEIPEGYVGLLFPRSSLSKYDLMLTNHVGVVDSGFRGEITFKFKQVGSYIPREYEIGDRVGQLLIIPYPQIELEEVTDLNETERGSGGFGHTGK
jgi:dUTP pyrophosphatase